MQWRVQIFCSNEGAVSSVLCKNIFVALLLGIQCLFEILQTSLSVKNSENVVKSGCFNILIFYIFEYGAEIFATIYLTFYLSIFCES